VPTGVHFENGTELQQQKKHQISILNSPKSKPVQFFVLSFVGRGDFCAV
jgi:hypothetical protein